MRQKDYSNNQYGGGMGQYGSQRAGGKGPVSGAGDAGGLSNLYKDYQGSS